MITVRRSILDSARNAILSCLGLRHTDARTNTPQEKPKDGSDEATTQDHPQKQPHSDHPTGVNAVEPASIVEGGGEFTVSLLVNQPENKQIPVRDSSAPDAAAVPNYSPAIIANDDSRAVLPDSLTLDASSEPRNPDLHSPTINTGGNPPTMSADPEPPADALLPESVCTPIAQQRDVLPLTEPQITDEPAVIKLDLYDPTVEATEEEEPVLVDNEDHLTTAQQLRIIPTPVVLQKQEDAAESMAELSFSTTPNETTDPALQILTKEDDLVEPTPPFVAVDSTETGRTSES